MQMPFFMEWQVQQSSVNSVEAMLRKGGKSLKAAMVLAQGVRVDGTADAAAAAAVLDDYDSSKEMAAEMRCRDAFTVILHFERTHCLALQVCPAASCGTYKSSRKCLYGPVMPTVLGLGHSVLDRHLAAFLAQAKSIAVETSRTYF